MILKNLFTCLFIVFFYQISFSTVRIVNNNPNAPSGHYTNLQAAIDASSTGDTLYIIGSSTVYRGNNGASAFINKRLTVIGTGYNPQKDYSITSKIFGFILNGGAMGSKFIGLYFTWKINALNVDSIEVSNCYFFTIGINSQIETRSYSNVYHCVFYTGSGGGGGVYLSGSNNLIHNNFFYTESNGVALSDAYLNNNGSRFFNNLVVGTSSSAFAEWGIQNYVIQNNIFYGAQPYSINFTIANSVFNNNLTYNTPNNVIPYGSNIGNNNILSTNPLFIDNIPFAQINYALNYKLRNSSPAKNAGTDGTDIGPFGGLTPFKDFTGYPDIPQIRKLEVTNPLGINDSLTIRLAGFSTTSDPIVEARFFIDSDILGIPIPIQPGNTFDFTYKLNYIQLGLGNHTFGLRVKNSRGIWSLPELRNFVVCQFSKPVASFSHYISGYDVILDNTSKNSETNKWLFSDGEISSQKSVVHHFRLAGTYSIKLIASNHCVSHGDTTSKIITIKGVNTVSPNSGGNNGPVTMTITGAGFTNLTKIKLTKIGESDILPISGATIISGGTKIQTTFYLKDVTTGQWNILIDIPGDTTILIANQFRIDPTKSPVLNTEMLSNNIIRLNQWSNLSFTISNSGNIDAVGVPLWIAVPATMGIKYNFMIRHPKDTIRYLNWDTIPEILTIDTLFDIYYEYKIIGLHISSIPAHLAKNITISVKATQQLTNVPILFWSSRPQYSGDSSSFSRNISNSNRCFIDPAKANCIADVILGLGGCKSAVFDFAFRPIANSFCYDDPGVDLGSIIESVAQIILVCEPPFDPYTATIQSVASIFTTAKQLDNCFKAFSAEIIKLKNFFTVNSFDPNMKIGKSGALNSPYINTSLPLVYSIHFENSDTATASAQTVIIKDSLNIDLLDLSTFHLKQFNFGDTTIMVPYGKKNYITDIDLRPSIPLIVRAAAFLNDSTGIVTWSFTSLDPVTMKPTENPLLGFLPPNDSTGRGRGFVSYTIDIKNIVHTGTNIKNHADIYFDDNQPIRTPSWINITDDLKPISSVSSLDRYTYSDSINVLWSGADNGPAGVYRYNIYYKVNNGKWHLWKHNTALTGDVFIGLKDSTYSFYSIAIDSALNIEDIPALPDAFTTIKSNKGLLLKLDYANVNCLTNSRLLRWIVTNERNEGLYQVLSSNNGTSGWKVIGNIRVLSNNSLYSFVDSLNSGMFYRIRKIDTAGNVYYSEVLKTNCFITFANVKVYPNPARDYLTIFVEVDRTKNIHFELYDSYGKLLRSINQIVYAGVSSILLNISTFPSGNYFLRATNSDIERSYKITIIN